MSEQNNGGPTPEQIEQINELKAALLKSVSEAALKGIDERVIGHALGVIMEASLAKLFSDGYTHWFMDWIITDMFQKVAKARGWMMHVEKVQLSDGDNEGSIH